MSDSADQAAVKGLQQYLKDEIALLEERVFDEWPYHGDEMELPAITVITAGTPLYTNYSNHILHSKSVDPDNAQNDILKEMIGQFDARIQLDIWTEYKIKRGEIFDLVDNALNKEYLQKDLPQGLSLTLANYHDVIARYDQVGYTYIDGEENSQKSQWRVKVDLLVNYPKIAVKSVPRISDITLTHQISEKVETSEDNTEVEEIIDIV